MKGGLLSTLYNTGAYSLGKNLDISTEEAQQFIDDFFTTYPQLKAFKDSVQEQADTVGYLNLLGGRKRRFIGHTAVAREYHRAHKQIVSILGREPAQQIWKEKGLPRDLRDKYQKLSKTYGEIARKTTNSLVQGSASNTMKIALINIEKHFREVKGDEWQVLSTIHDEVLMEIPATATVKEIEEIENIMSSAMTLSIPLKVDTECMKRWGAGISKKQWIEQGCQFKEEQM